MIPSRIVRGLLAGATILAASVATTLAPAPSPAESAGPAGSAGSVSASWPSDVVRRGAAISVRGRTWGMRPGTAVKLQQHVLGGWRAVGWDRVDQRGRYTIQVPTWWLGHRSYRVTTSRGAASKGWGLTVLPAYTPPGRSWQHEYASGGQMARWDPCRTIRWRINNRQAAPGAFRDTKEAFRRLARATGYRFVYVGNTRGIPQYDANTWYPDDTHVVVAWARRGQSSLFDAYPTARGVGAAYYRDGYRNGDGSPTQLIDKGMVVIDSRAQLPAGFGRGVTRGDALLHELGHVLGLAHEDSRSQIMYRYWTSATTNLGRGDLTAYERRGARLGCVTSGTTSRPATSGRAVTGGGAPEPGTRPQVSP